MEFILRIVEQTGTGNPPGVVTNVVIGNKYAVIDRNQAHAAFKEAVKEESSNDPVVMGFVQYGDERVFYNENQFVYIMNEKGKTFETIQNPNLLNCKAV